MRECIEDAMELGNTLCEASEICAMLCEGGKSREGSRSQQAVCDKEARTRRVECRYVEITEYLL